MCSRGCHGSRAVVVDPLPRPGLRFSPRRAGLAPLDNVLHGQVELIDVGFGDAVVGDAEVLTCDDLLSIAGVPPTRTRAVPKAQQFAEKIHAYTFPW